ncbi:MAG: MlaD family protein [Candidatus Marinimicrobia bacterium]|nr:MlaD family protein [Candidatus Neomarinimicrobiota bacterium]MCF7830081.1 MlaD family protein [Candidatus Neomarinimicrobiota bacterium]MCF7882128.1 MlaD family protein [Candidatus Neomarinimicrobiota bacterium]
MDKQRKMELLVGATVIIGVVAVISVILWGRGALFSSKSQELTMKFAQVGGLTASDIVSVSGVNVGRVKSLEIIQDSVLVKVRVNKNISVREDASAAIVNAELMGGKKIDLSPGRARRALPQGKVITGEYVPGIMDLAGVLEDREDDFDTLLSDLLVTVRSLKEVLGADTADSERNLRSVMENVASTTGQVDTLMRVNARAIKTTVENLEESSRILRNFLGTEEDRAKTLLATSESLANKVSTLSDSTQVLIDKMNNPNTSIGRLVQNDSLYRQLSHSVVSLDSLIIDIKKNPKKYLNVKVSPF